MPHAVQEIDHEPDCQPHNKTNPGHHRQAQHQHKTHEYAEDWENWHERHAKRAWTLRGNAAQYVYAETNQNKCKERSDVCEISEIADVRDHGHDTDNNSSPNGRDMRGAEPRMNFGEILRQQAIARHGHEDARLTKLKHEQH